MFRGCLALTLLLAAHVTTTAAAQPPVGCNEAALGDAADTARSNIITGTDGAAAIEAWRHVLGSGGAIGWTVTEYNVDPRSMFVFAFDREALRVYRASAFGEHVDRATGGCVDSSIPPEAVIPWRQVREIEAGNWVLWFRLREPVTIRSDRGHRKRVDELKVFFHGAGGGDLTFYYNLRREGRIPFWNVDVYTVENLRGIAVGPTDFQRRLQFVIAQAVDPDERISMKRKGRGAGW
jgi:hypothetical protein